MRGFPLQLGARVTHAKQLDGPYNRWSFQNIQELNLTADVWRSNGQVTAFDEDPLELDPLTFER